MIKWIRSLSPAEILLILSGIVILVMSLFFEENAGTSGYEHWSKPLKHVGK